jgi:hypothetical protein
MNLYFVLCALYFVLLSLVLKQAYISIFKFRQKDKAQSTKNKVQFLNVSFRPLIQHIQTPWA